jgi:hypothetical protein
MFDTSDAGLAWPAQEADPRSISLEIVLFDRKGRARRRVRALSDYLARWFG